MKIKAVCEETGLTDRTIRYYIEEGLISPQYTENYLGRKNFNFTQENIAELKHIAILRSFNFSVEEICCLIQDSASCPVVIEAVKRRTQEAVTDGENKLSVLMQLDTNIAYSVADLAERITQISLDVSPKAEEIKVNFWKSFCTIIKAVLTFIIVWFPVALSFFVLFNVRMSRYYPVYSLKGILLLFLGFLPSCLTVIISIFKFGRKIVLRCILLCLCILSIPYCFFIPMTQVIVRSETDNILNYRDFDVKCGLNTNKDFADLFPITAPILDADAKYYYRFIEDYDSTCDVYAEWTLKEDEFRKEIERAEALFKQQKSGYKEIKQGNYKCFILEDEWNRHEPFTPVTDSYSYLIFAYDEENLRVRYIYCYSLQDGAVQPYYLSLKW